MATSTDIQTQLDAVNTAITRVLTGGQEYSLDTGQTKQFNKRASLKDLEKLKYSLESDLSLALKKKNLEHKQAEGYLQLPWVIRW